MQLRPVLGGAGSVSQHSITTHEETQPNRVSYSRFSDAFFASRGPSVEIGFIFVAPFFGICFIFVASDVKSLVVEVTARAVGWGSAA